MNRSTDTWLILTVALLVVFGMVMVYSASAVVALEHTGDEAHYLTRQLMATALGLALCVVCVSGVQLWLYKRARKKGPQPRLERAWIALVWGPVALIGLCLTLDRVFGIADSLLAPVFWIGLVALAGLSQFAPSKAGLSCGLKLTGATLLLIGASAHFLAYGASGYQNPAAWGVFAGIILSALLLTGDALRQPRAEAMPAVVPGD